MTISALTGSGGATTAAQSATSLADTFDTFLNLLTTQLKHQDPLEPMDSAQFTEQLVQFTGVEQSIATNNNLEQLLSLQLSSQTAAAVSYIGQNVKAKSEVGELKNGNATWQYDVAADAASVDISITDANGVVVYTDTGQTSAGSHSFSWNGENQSGSALPEGLYAITVSAKDAAGEDIATTTYTTGTVDGVENTDAGPQLTVGQMKVPINSVVTISSAGTA